MAALWILGILLALILLLLLLRVGVHVRFGDALCVTAMAGPVRLQLVPKPEKKKPEKPKKEKPVKEKPEKAGSDARRYPQRTAGTVGVPEAGAAENPEASAHRPHAAFGVLRRR